MFQIVFQARTKLVLPTTLAVVTTVIGCGNDPLPPPDNCDDPRVVDECYICTHSETGETFCERAEDFHGACLYRGGDTCDVQT